MIELTQEQYKAQLLLFKKAIEDGLELKYFDDTTIGDKDTQATWGLCSRVKEMWPDKETHLWPDDIRDSEYIYGIKYLKGNQFCPFDKRDKHNGQGCFYSCKIFQATKKDPIPTREEAIKLYDRRISLL